jgi:hypothetical protein
MKGVFDPRVEAAGEAPRIVSGADQLPMIGPAEPPGPKPGPIIGWYGAACV